MPQAFIFILIFKAKEIGIFSENLARLPLRLLLFKFSEYSAFPSNVRCAHQLRQALGEPWEVGFSFQRAFPDRDDMPAEGAEGVFVAEVAGMVVRDLRLPEGVTGFWKAEVLAVFMSVPEAAVDEDDGAVFR